MIKKKTLFTTGINIAASVGVVAIATSCGTPTQTEKTNSLDVSLISKELNLTNNNYSLELNVGSDNSNKYVDVHVSPSPSEPDTASDKVLIDNNGIATVLFSEQPLESNETYYITQVNIYNNEDDIKPSIVQDYPFSDSENLEFTTLGSDAEITRNPDEEGSKNTSSIPTQNKNKDKGNPSTTQKNDKKDISSTTRENDKKENSSEIERDDKKEDSQAKENASQREDSQLKENNNTNENPSISVKVENTEHSKNSTPIQGDNFPGMLDPSALTAFLNKINEAKKQKEENRPRSKEVTELKITEDKAYEKIKDRSFAIGFNSVDYTIDPGTHETNTSVVPFIPTGTGWLLDYAWKNGQNQADELMLYIATNAHVYARAFNAMESKFKNNFPEYFAEESQKNARVDSFALAVPQKDADLKAIPSGSSYEKQNNLTWFVNTSDSALFSSDRSNKDLHFVDKDLFSNPRTVFVALNIFDSADNSKLVDQYNNNAQRKYIGKDFAVFGVKVNYKKLMEEAKHNNALELLLDHIKKAMKSIGTDVQTFKNDKYLNHDPQDVPYLSFDYPSAWSDKEKGITLNANTSLNIERAYILGFPSISGRQMLWRNYPSNSSIPRDVFNGLSFTKGLPINQPLDEHTQASGFGFNANVDYSSLSYGASGSMVVNEYGLPIGIYSTVSIARNNTGDSETNTSNKGGFTFLVQVHDDPEKGPAHNLIDGTDSHKFPKQQKSYRQNLRYLTNNNSSDFKDFGKTALFPSGV